jgi:hypothetical protein
VRVVIVAAVVLICWGCAAPLSAIEAVYLPVSCNYVGDKVVLVPSADDRLHVIVGDREHKTIKACAPGLEGKCRHIEIHRFELLCGGRTVHWRSIAEQLLHLAASPAKRDALLGAAPLKPWELRIWRAETGFAPVDEVGGRIMSFEDKSTPQPPASPLAADTKAVVAPQSAAPRPVTPQFEPGSVAEKIEPPKLGDEISLFQSESSPPGSAGPISRDASTPPASGRPETIADKTKIASSGPSGSTIAAKPGDVATLPQLNELRREVDSASDATPEIMSGDAPLADKFAVHESAGKYSGRFLILFASALLVIFIFLMVVWSAVTRWTAASSRQRAHYGGMVRFTLEADTGAEAATGAEADACRELMKQVAADLARALSAINSLRRLPALQNALHKELDSIMRLLGFTPQLQGASDEKENRDWNQIKSQLMMSLQGTQRIIGIAEAARTSFSVHPAALEVITTRLEAYAFLGVNASSSETVLKKAVNALRQCWHPDLATDEEDRRLREIRTKQINVAWDLISRKQMSAY